MADLFQPDGPPEQQPLAGLFATVALEQGIDAAAGGLTYRVPLELSDLRVGDRVRVPLGRGDALTHGYVTGLLETCPYPHVKTIRARDAGSLSLTPDLLALAEWMSGYYCCPLGMVFSSLMPAAVKKGTGTIRQRLVGLSEAALAHLIKQAGTEVEASDAAKGEGAGGEGPNGTVANASGSLSAAKPGDDSSQPSSIASANDTDVTVYQAIHSIDSPKASTPDESSEESAAPAKAKLTKLQRAVLAVAGELRKQGQTWVDIKELADRAGAKTLGPVTQLLKRGLLESHDQPAVRARRMFETQSEMDAASNGSDDPELAKPLALNAAQANAVDAIERSLGKFHVFLLHGVTGSGKTEVYLRAIEAMRARAAAQAQGPGEGPSLTLPARFAQDELSFDAAEKHRMPAAIVLVPEIALTPQTVARFLRRFERVAVLHSGLTAAQRHEQWRKIRAGEADVVVGARSAIFAPIDNIGLIIVDEEHESGYKQDQLPRYHARDVAIKRAQLLGAPIVLGSATPALESWHNAVVRGNYTLLSMPERVPGLSLPRVEVVDMVAQRAKRYQYTGSATWHLLSLPLEAALRQAFKDGGQAILLLNRRGYANYIACPDHQCGWQSYCDYCDATMVYHKEKELPLGGLVRCHHCGAEKILPSKCPMCGKTVVVFGLGTQRVEEEIAKAFPGVACIRMDSDTMRTARDYHASLEAFRTGAASLLLGTQMVAKGLDFPNVRVVGVVSADTALNLPDFRAAERTFQLVSQVAGRCGRGGHPGVAYVQTFNAEDAAIRLAAAHDYVGFAGKELDLRRKVGLPPVTRMARIVVRDRDEDKAARHAEALYLALDARNRQLGGAATLRGPAPCALSKIAEHFRYQIELYAPTPAPLQQLITSLRNERRLKSDNKTAVDVDPVSLM